MIRNCEMPFSDDYERSMRYHRNVLLAASDWTQAHDDPTGKRDEWATYRQALRDFPSTWTPGPVADFPDPPGGE